MDINEYLRSKKMIADPKDIPKYSEEFRDELTAALKGQPSQLQPLPSRLGVPKLPRNTEKLLAVDFGGTNIRLAEICFDKDGLPHMENYCQEKIESGRLDKDYFFGWLGERIARYDIEDVGFVFSYQAEILPNGDAKIVSLSKGLSVPDAIGLELGKEINKKLADKGQKPRRFTVLNDTTAVFLSAAASLEKPESLAAAVIAGTGSNCCNVWQEEIINIEWELFSNFTRGEFDVILDDASDNAGEHQTGKMVGGKYLAMLVDMCCQGAEAEGVHGDPEAIRQAAYDAIYTRAAIFIVAMLRGVVLMAPALEKCREEGGPLYVCIEGGTYDHAPGYKESIGSLIHEYIELPLGIQVRIVQLDNAVITGAALAALGNSRIKQQGAK